MPYRRSSAPRASARAAASSNSLPPASVTATRRLELEEITPLSVAAYVEQLGTAAEDRGAAVAGGIGRVQSAADFDDDVVAEGNVSAQSIGKMIFPAVAGPQDVKPTDSPCAAENTVDQNLPEEDRLVYKPSLNRRAKRKF